MKNVLIASLFLLAGCADNAKLRTVSLSEAKVELQKPGFQTDSFSQLENEKKRVNFLFVIDNSQSMDDDITAIGQNFTEFTNYLTGANGEIGIDFKIKVTTSDMRENGTQPFQKFNPTDGFFTFTNPYYNFYKDHVKAEDLTSGFDFSSKTAVNQPEYFKEMMNSLFTMGSGFPGSSRLPEAIAIGSNSERMLEATKGFIESKESYFTEDANIALVLVSDEREHSRESAVEIVDLIRSKKIGHKNNKILSFSFINPSQMDTDYQVIVDLSDGGLVKPIENMAENLNNLGEFIKDELLSSFTLSKTPKNFQGLEVIVDGKKKVLGTEFNYEPTTNSIKFTEKNIPKTGSKISVEYEI